MNNMKRYILLLTNKARFENLHFLYIKISKVIMIFYNSNFGFFFRKRLMVRKFGLHLFIDIDQANGYFQ